ncbi:MAG TPA: hypothetical protein VLX30_14590 [Burkholderiales bacterium]|nr:hypothetical protein [Burkholderiales bacterium]
MPDGNLSVARVTCAKTGFKLVRKARCRGFGRPLVAEYRERDPS